ncbi:PT domain-containing protein [Burkholderia vietnamiensis]|nr:PT domain-containing protein [Burkholderia vietnamiensis]
MAPRSRRSRARLRGRERQPPRRPRRRFLTERFQSVAAPIRGRSAKQPTSRPADQPTSRPADQPTSRPADQPTSRLDVAHVVARAGFEEPV